MRQFTSTPTPAEENPLNGVKFELDGVEFKCEGRASVLESSVLASAAAEDAGDGYSAAAMGAVADFLRMSFGDSEFQRFRSHCRRRSTSDETLLDIMQGIREEIEANAARISERPTRSPSSSLPGRPGLDDRSSLIIGLQEGDVQVIRQATEAGQAIDPGLAAERAEQAAAKAEARRKPGRKRQDAASRTVRVG
jgi:hypothetical protein